MNFRFITHLETFAVNAQLHRLVAGDIWAGKTSLAHLTLDDIAQTFLLRAQNDASSDNWSEDLPMHDQSEFERWKSLRALLSRARKAIAVDPVIAPALDLTAPLGRVVISALQARSITPWRSVTPWRSGTGDYAKRYLQFHVALVTNPRAFLYCGGEGVHVPPGALVYFNSAELHCAANFGEAPAAHLVFGLRRREAPDTEA